MVEGWELVEEFEENYYFDEILGEGTFSIVYKSYCSETENWVAVKVITRTSAPNRILEELKVLKILNGENNCIKLLNVMRHKDQIIIVFPLLEAIEFKEFITTCSIRDVKKYMYSLLIAIKHMQDHNIIHRDIKPSNFMYNVQEEKGTLIDFGLAQYCTTNAREKARIDPPVLFFNSIITSSKPPGYFERDNRPALKASRAGTRGFRAPEVLFKYTNQSPAIDIWSAGVILLSILTAQYPFFLSMQDIDGLVEIALLFGHYEMRKAARHYGRIWRSNIPGIKEEGINFITLIQNLNPDSDLDYDAIDLLEQMLVLIDDDRITAQEALNHKFFKDI